MLIQRHGRARASTKIERVLGDHSEVARIILRSGGHVCDQVGDVCEDLSDDAATECGSGVVKYREIGGFG